MSLFSIQKTQESTINHQGQKRKKKKNSFISKSPRFVAIPSGSIVLAYEVKKAEEIAPF